MTIEDVDTNARMEELSKFENLRNTEVLERLHLILQERMQFLSEKLHYPPECDHKAHKAFNHCPYTPLQRWRYEQEKRQSTEAAR